MNRSKGRADLQELLDKVSQLVKEKPDLAARVLDEWVKKPDGRKKSAPPASKNEAGRRVEEQLGLSSKKKKIA